MKFTIETARWICIAATVAMAAQVSAQTWTAPVVLSAGGQGWEAAAAIDGDGNSLALWDERTTQDQLWSRAKASGASWGSVTEVSPALQTTSVFPVVRIAAAGFATAVWTDQSGVWTADRPATWSSPLVLSGSDTSVGQVIFAVAPSGAALTIWLSSSGTPAVRAITRATATGAWSTPVNISGPGSYISPEAAAVESSGNAIAIYSGYDASSVHTEYATTYQP